MKRIYLVVAGVVIVAAALCFLNYATITRELSVLDLTPKPEAFTELYFYNYYDLAESLPTSIQNGSQIPFSFIIHNVEGKEMTYPYVIYMVDQNNSTTTIASGSVVLPNGSEKTIEVPYAFTSSYLPSQVTVFVSLPQEGESIHFFVPNKN